MLSKTFLVFFIFIFFSSLTVSSQKTLVEFILELLSKADKDIEITNTILPRKIIFSYKNFENIAAKWSTYKYGRRSNSKQVKYESYARSVRTLDKELIRKYGSKRGTGTYSIDLNHAYFFNSKNKNNHDLINSRNLVINKHFREQVMSSSFYPEPTQPTQPSELTQPTQPSELTQPTQPSELTQPTQPSELTQPTQPSELTQPTEWNFKGIDLYELFNKF